MVFVLNDYLFFVIFLFFWVFFNLMAVASQSIIIFKHRKKDKFNQLILFSMFENNIKLQDDCQFI